jgi:hypothetical protein
MNCLEAMLLVSFINISLKTVNGHRTPTSGRGELGEHIPSAQD